MATATIAPHTTVAISYVRAGKTYLDVFASVESAERNLDNYGAGAVVVQLSDCAHGKAPGTCRRRACFTR